MGKVKKRRSAKNSRGTAVEEPDKQYEVEVILAVEPMKGQRGKYWYLVQWWGYPGEDTWEPVESLKDCDRLLMSLWRAIGAVDFNSRKKFMMPKDWIESEKEYFRQTFHVRKSTWHKQPAIGLIEDNGRRQVRFYD